MAEALVKPSRAKRMYFKTREFFTTPANIILTVTVVVLGFFTVYPLFLLIKDTVTVNLGDLMYPELLKKGVGAFTMFHWKRMLFSDMSATTSGFRSRTLS